MKRNTRHRKRTSKGAFLFYIAIAFACTFIVSTFLDLDSQKSVDPTQYLSDPKETEMLKCLKKILQNLPIGNGRLPRHKRIKVPKVFAHHYDAGNFQTWNAHIRLEPIEEMDRADCSFWEIGAHEDADDSRQMMKKYPNCQYHAFEPIPDYYETLQQKWKDTPNMHTYNYGLGINASSFNFSPDLLQGQATYLGDAKKEEEGGANDSKKVHIQPFDHALKDTGGKLPTVLHLNCEGCEWDMIPEMVQANFLQNVPYLQIGWHNYGKSTGSRAWQLCVHTMLQKSHRLLENGVPFAWERWVRKSRKIL